MAMRHVIVGGGPAGWYGLETIRLFDRDSPVTFISDEPAYARMVLPYYMAGEIPEAQVFTGSDRYFAQMKVEPVFGRRVTAVDATRRTLTLDNGQAVHFETLLIATGSSPARLPVPGAELDGVHTLWTLEDARRAIKLAKKGARVLFVGAGFIGFIILNALHKVGCQLSVVEVERQVLPRMLDAKGAELVQGWLAAQKVETYCGTSVKEIARGADGRKVVTLADGRQLIADLVILATGIRPNLDLVKGSGIRVNQGILVDERMQTSAPGIYAAGDVAEGPDLSTGQQAIHAIQPTAIDHGRVAGANMAGRDVRYAGSLLMNILDVCGLQCVSYGLWREERREITLLLNPARPIYRKLIWEGDQVVGAIFIGPAEDVCMLNDVGMVKGLIQTKTRLGPWKAHLQKNPLDIRKPYVATNTAAALLKQSILGQASEERRFRYRDLAPGTTPAHEGIFVGRPPA
ncbi:MAG: NAD(P)/FAD-dependent oxidoreductase [Deltaproteobacteria bacterium]|nr:NAD(P)/FAD-dependent oxidoreductase [Deltaproteobacteria bacterium]